MKYMHSEWQRRLDHWLKTLKDDLYLPLGEMETEGFLTMEQLSPDEALKGSFSPMKKGTKWGRTWEYCWLRGKITLPAEAQGKRIVIDLKTGGEATVFVDGRSFGTYRAGWVKEPHHFLVDNFLTGCGEAGRSYDILLEAYAGHFFPQSPLGGCATGPVLPGSYQDPKKEGERREFMGITYGIWNEDAYQLYMDLDTLRQLGDQIVPESLRADKVAQALEEATIAIDFEQPLEGRIASYREARQILKGVLEAKNGSTMPKFYAIGNAHLDLAWLWPMAETYRKTSRTFAAQLRLLDEYPDYRYLQSQPAAYEMCREYYPELFERIREAAKEGRWIPEGAMWVEPDTNMTSGESLVRQVLHGKRYFRDVFGVDSLILWLPDSFGYSAALPQILKKTGVKYLVTQKIFWSYNEGDQFPYHYFTWKGADGSSIDTFLPTSYTYRTDPQEICETWKGRVQKRGLDAFLLPFGYGDGGGGPTRDHIEYLEREKDLEGMPRMVCESPVKFFEDMEAEGGPKHTYVGELYFSAHRGVFTSQADIKKGNRKSELALREAEIWGAAASAKKNYQYPLEKMDAAWKKLLLNQFHDILPGSSIARVYEDARADHRWIISQAEEVKEEAFRALTEGEGVTVFNSLSFERTGLVDLPAEYAGGAEAADGTVFRTMEKDGAVKALVTVPACGSISLKPAAGKAEEKDCAAARAYVSENGIVIENEKVRALIDECIKEIISLADRREEIKTTQDYFRIRSDKYSVINGLDHSKHVFVLDGYVPESDCEKLNALCTRVCDCVVEFDDAGDDAPVKLKNNKFAEPAEGILNMYSPPGKSDIDPTPILAFFFYFFFGMMFSDAGYGILMVIATGLMIKLFKPDKKMRNNLKLFQYCGISTTLWGFAFGSFFGDAPAVLYNTFTGNEMKMADFFLWPTLDPQKDALVLMIVSIAFGLIHILVGMGCKFIVCIRQKDYAGAFFDTGLWMLMLIGFAVLAAGMAFAPILVTVGAVIAIACAVGLVLTQGRGKKGIDKRARHCIYDFDFRNRSCYQYRS